MLKPQQASPEARHRAQELAYEAMTSNDPIQVQILCAQALELDPRCTDAMLIVSRLPLSHGQRIKSLKLILKMALEDLGGAGFIEENRGLFWGLLETRPYMRARSYLAMEYLEAGRLPDAIAECKAMLELNPDDHQGMRHTLLSAYLAQNDYAGLRSILDRFSVETEAIFAWTQVLERFRAGDEAGAGRALALARCLNPYFEAYANGSQPLPLELSGMYVHGEESEAVFCCSLIGKAWLDQPGLVEWMTEQRVARPGISGAKTGRNDPCPCGSGKKYKKCCGSHPASSSQPPAIVHSAPNATSVAGESFMHGFKTHLGDREFESEEELAAQLQEYQQQVNQRPLADFHGLSPEQVMGLLNDPFNAPELLEFPAFLAEAPTGQLAELFALLATAIGSDGIKPTATGNLPRNVVREIALAHMGEAGYAAYTRLHGINSELDYHELATVRFTAELAGMIRIYKRRFILSRLCRDLLDNGGLQAVYPELFRAFVEDVEWSGFDLFPVHGFFQESFAYTLYLLDRFGSEWRPASFYEDEFIRAFPILLEEIDLALLETREATLRRMYSSRCLHRFAGFAGLVEIEAPPGDLLLQQFKLRKTSLLNQVVKFHVP